MLANFILSHPPHPSPSLRWEGEQKPCPIKLLLYLVMINKINIEPYYPCTLLSFVDQKNEKKKKNKKLKFVNENYIYCSWGIIF